MKFRASDKGISRCPDCGAWRWWYRCWTCVPKAAQIHEIEEAS